MIRRLFDTLRAEASFLVLLAVAAAGAWMYVQMQQLRADRDGVVHQAEIICSKAGSGWSATKGAKRGTACEAHVAGLAHFRAETAEQTARLLADEMKAASARTLKDNQAARAAAEAARSAAMRMEAADAEAERRNLVDREWFAAVNGVAGLRPAAR